VVCLAGSRFSGGRGLLEKEAVVARTSHDKIISSRRPRWPKNWGGAGKRLRSLKCENNGQEPCKNNTHKNNWGKWGVGGDLFNVPDGGSVISGGNRASPKWEPDRGVTDTKRASLKMVKCNKGKN